MTWASNKARELSLGRVGLADAIRETIEEAARRCQQLADDSIALDKADGVPRDSLRGVTANGYLNGCLFAKEAVEAMLTEKVDHG